MYYILTDVEGEDLGMIKVTNVTEVPNFEEEVSESWNEFHRLEEHGLDVYDINEFVDWHNETHASQIERIYFGVLCG